MLSFFIFTFSYAIPHFFRQGEFDIYMTCNDTEPGYSLRRKVIIRKSTLRENLIGLNISGGEQCIFSLRYRKTYSKKTLRHLNY